MYRVAWLPKALLQIRQIVERANDPLPVFEAMEALDLKLRANPEEESESRDGPRRVAFARPLGVQFTISGDQVGIGLVWAFNTR